MRAKFETMAKSGEEESRKRAEEERARRQAQEKREKAEQEKQREVMGGIGRLISSCLSAGRKHSNLHILCHMNIRKHDEVLVNTFWFTP